MVLRLVAASLSMMFIANVAYAHGGGLDGMGCHHNRKQGGYHCHRGPLAGQSFATKEDAIKAMDSPQKRPSGAAKPKP